MTPDYDRLLHLLYGPLAESGWATDFLEGLARATRSRSAAVVAVDLVARTDTLPAFVGAEAASAIAYEKQYGKQNPWRSPSGSRAQAAGDLVVSDAVLPLDELKRTLFWSEFLRPMDVAHGLGMAGLHAEPRLASLTLLRDERRGPYAGHDLALARRLAPHWVNACRLREHLGLLTDTARGLGDVVDALSLAVFLLDHEGQLVRVNAAADELLTQGDLVALQRGRLIARQGRASVPLARAIESAATHPLRGLNASAVPFTDAQGQVVAHAAAHPVTGGLRGRAARVALFVQRVGANSDGTALPRALRNAYGLTAREAELACLLDGTRDLADAAETMRITLGGARTRLKILCAKLGVRGQQSLLALIQSLRAAIGAP